MICIKDFDGQGISGHVSIREGTLCELNGRYICHKGMVICVLGSEIANTHFKSILEK